MTELMKRYEAETDEIATWCWHNKHIVTDDVLDWAWGKIRTLEAENEKLREDASEVFIREMSMKNGSFDATFESGIGPVIATYIAKMLESHHAINFVTTLMASTRGIEGEKYYMTMGRCNGKNVDEKYHEVMSENAKLRTQLESLEQKTIEKFQKIIRTQCDEISALKAQLTWRPVSEKPEKDDEDYFTRSAKGDVVKMRYHDGMFFIWDDEVSMYFLPMDKPKYYLPIPPMKEEK